MIDDYSLEKKWEGLRLKAYIDPGSKNGLPATIGYGHTGTLSQPVVKLGDTITEAQALTYLNRDMAAVDAIIAKYVKVSLNDNQLKALRSFVFNIGETLFRKSSVLRYINDGRMAEVPGRMALYRINDGAVMDGLVRRRSEEGTVWMTPIASSPTQPLPIPSQATPANPKKPWDWGAAGAFITLLASFSGDVKKVIGDLTSALGISPLIILAVIGVGFGAWTLYSKWKDK